MNYLISTIQNFEQCNAGVPLSLLREAAADVIQEIWCDAQALIEAIEEGGIDYEEEAKNVNDALEEAGCFHRVGEQDVRKGLASWMELQALMD